MNLKQVPLLVVFLAITTLACAQQPRPNLRPVAATPPGTTGAIQSTALPSAEQIHSLKQKLEQMQGELEYYKSQLAYISQENTISNQPGVRETRQAADKAFASWKASCAALPGELQQGPQGLACIPKK